MFFVGYIGSVDIFVFFIGRIGMFVSGSFFFGRVDGFWDWLGFYCGRG